MNYPSLILHRSPGLAKPLRTTLVGCMLFLAGSLAAVSAQPPTPTAKEQPFLQILQSSSTPGEKGLACKNLAIYGSDAAVPVLRPLLADTNLSSWARIALQAIPGDAANAALREAATELKGRLLAGVINSIGIRRDAKATPILTQHLKNSDMEVVAAAADALGRIGGTNPARALTAALAKADGRSKTIFAHGVILCAERFLKDGNPSQAAKLYDLARNSGAARQKVLEATRGAILARGSKGVPLLLEQLRSTDRTFVNIGLRTARELPGTDVTLALCTELDRASAELRPMLLLALGDRNDPAALPAFLKASRQSDPRLRLAAIEILDRKGDPKAADVLLDIAAEGTPEISTRAAAAVGRMASPSVDQLLVERISTAAAPVKAAAIELAAQRRLEQALPQITKSTSDQDTKVRNAALQYLSVLGGPNELPNLVELLAHMNPSADNSRLETAVVAVCGRVGSNAAKVFLPLMRASAPEVRLGALQALTAAGGSEALQAVNAAACSEAATLQDEAVRALATWPNNWPEDATVLAPLAQLAKDGKKDSHRILATRGYLEFLQNSSQMSPADKAAKLKLILPMVTRNEEKRLALIVAQQLSGPDAIGFAQPYLSEPAMVEDASAALIRVTISKKDNLPAEDRAKALRLVIEKTRDAKTREEAQKLLQ